MSNYNSLKATINANIKTNGNQEITGSVLNSVLTAMVNTLGAGYMYTGVATPSTNPGSPDSKVFYLAATAGTYTHFGGLVVDNDEIAILKWDTTWNKDVTGIASSARVRILAGSVGFLMENYLQKDPMLFDYTERVDPISNLSELTATLVRKSTNKIEAGSTQGILYFPVVAGHKYVVKLNNLYCEGSYSIVSFCATTPQIGADTTLVFGVSSSSSVTDDIEYTAQADGYLLALYNTSSQKSRISAEEIVSVPVPKFLSADDIDSALSFSSEKPVQNKVITQNLLSEVISYEDKILTDNNGLIVRKSNNKVEAGNTNTGIMSFPVVAGHRYRINLNALYAVGTYSTISFSPTTPVVGDTTTPIWGVSSTGTYTESVEYIATENGYVFVLYNATSQRSRITAQEVISTLVSKYAERFFWEGKKWAAIGDSLTESNRRTLKNYHGFVHDETGIEVQNLGVGGTGYANGLGDSNAFYNRVASIASDADVITIFGSFNDMSVSLPLGDVSDTGFNSICGCINETLSAIQTAFPLINLGVVTPTPWASQRPTASGDSSAELYVNAIIEICKIKSIPCLDLFHCSNLRPWDADFRAVAYRRDGTYTESTQGTPGAVQVTADILEYVRVYGGLPNAQVGDWVLPSLGGVHPDERGHKLIASRFEEFIKTLLLH